MENVKQVFWVDLFSGAGGVTTGIHLTGKAKVVACVNHDKNAIESHKANHPECEHFVEDIRTLDVSKLVFIVNRLRKEHAGCFINLWASLECTNFSKAKGGLPRDADSRTLALDMFRYIKAIQPSYIFIENVREFMCWGPLDHNGKPLSRNCGIDYMNWVNTVKSFGYNYDYKILNAADYGAYTSRERYFGQFAYGSLPIVFPSATHTKNPSKEALLFDAPLHKWKPVKEVLDLTDEGESIFSREKPLVENTLKRIYAGLDKFVAYGDTSFMQKYYSGRPAGKVTSCNAPAGTVTTVGGQSIVTTQFLKHIHGGDPKTKVWEIESATRTVTSSNQYLVSANFLVKYYGKSSPVDMIDCAPTLTTKDRLAIVSYLMLNYTTGTNVRSIDNPAATVVANDKHNIVSAKYLMNPQFKNNGTSIEKPCFTLIARMDKKPPYLISTEKGETLIAVYEDDSETMIKIKQFMAYYGIYDIKMRMLKIPELLRIQGFPVSYVLKGSQTEQKKYIGNAVECNMAKSLAEANYQTIQNYIEPLLCALN